MKYMYRGSTTTTASNDPRPDDCERHTRRWWPSIPGESARDDVINSRNVYWRIGQKWGFRGWDVEGVQWDGWLVAGIGEILQQSYRSGIPMGGKRKVKRDWRWDWRGREGAGWLGIRRGWFG